MKRSFYKLLPFILIGVVLLISIFLVVKPSLNFTLFGDDWLVLYDLKYGPLGSVFGPYAIPFRTMFYISKIWGYSSFPYFLSTFLSRCLASLGITFLIYKLTKNYLAGFISGLFFGIALTGMETLNWGPFNQPTYWAIFLFCIAIWYYIRSWKNIVNIIPSLFLAIVAVMMFPQRMHGVVILFPLVDIFWIITQSTKFKRDIFSFLFKIFLIGIAFYFLNGKSTFGGSADMVAQIEQTKNDAMHFGVNILINLVKSFGNMIIPNTFWSETFFADTANSLIGKSVLTPQVKPFLILFIFFTFAIGLLKQTKRFRFIFISIFFGILGVFYIKFLIANTIYLQGVGYLWSFFVGGSTLIWILSQIILDIRSRTSFYLLVFTSFFFAMIFVPWIRSSMTTMDTIFRYVTVPSVSIALLIGIIFASIKKRKSKFIFLSVFGVLLLIQGIMARQYLEKLYINRNSFVYDSLWEQFKKETKNYKPADKFAVFYFEGDPGLIYNVFSFGFPPRIGLLYDVKPSEEGQLPIIIDDFKNLKSAINNGQFVVAFAKKPQKISLDRVYAFRIEGDKLTNIKEDIVQRLKK